MTSVTGGSRGELESARPLGGGAYVPALDGIRALAVAAVLAFHGGVPHTSGGYLGVSLFFTLSGFLLTAVLLRKHAGTGRISILRFWERRFRRLLPAAIVTLAAIALLAPRLGPPDASGSLRFDLLSALGYGANWRFLAADQSYTALFVAPSPVQHFWSLSIEEQFYVAFPLLLAGLSIWGGTGVCSSRSCSARAARRASLCSSSSRATTVPTTGPTRARPRSWRAPCSPASSSVASAARSHGGARRRSSGAPAS